DENGRGVQFIGQPAMEFSASHFTADDLYRATHTYELTPRAEVVVNVDYAHANIVLRIALGCLSRNELTGWAKMRYLVDELHPTAERTDVVLDNLKRTPMKR